MTFEPVELTITELDLLAGSAVGALAKAEIKQSIYQSVHAENYRKWAL